MLNAYLNTVPEILKEIFTLRISPMIYVIIAYLKEVEDIFFGMVLNQNRT